MPKIEMNQKKWQIIVFLCLNFTLSVSEPWPVSLVYDFIRLQWSLKSINIIHPLLNFFEVRGRGSSAGTSGWFWQTQRKWLCDPDCKWSIILWGQQHLTQKESHDHQRSTLTLVIPHRLLPLSEKNVQYIQHILSAKKNIKDWIGCFFRWVAI